MVDAMLSSQLGLISEHIKGIRQEQSRTNEELKKLIEVISALTNALSDLSGGKEAK